MILHGPVLGIDVGGTRTKFGLVDLAERKIIVELVRPTCTDGFEQYLLSISEAFGDLCQSGKIDQRRVRACGVGLPGFVGPRISALWKPLSFLEGNQLVPALARTLQMPIRADNDARLVALGEANFASPSGAQRLLSLTLGSGLGFGFVVQGRLQEPTSINHLAGHIPVRSIAERCYCGFHGCLEMLVSASGLMRSYREALTAAPDGDKKVAGTAEEVFEAAQSQSPAAVRGVRQWLVDLSAGLNEYIYLFGPNTIVIGGGLSKSLDPWMRELESLLFALPREGYTVELKTSRLQESAGVLGAAALFLS